MKKIIAILVATLVLAGAWSCKKGSGNGPDGPTENSVLLIMTEQTSTSATFKVELTSKDPILRRGLIWVDGDMTPSYEDTQHNTELYPLDEKNFTMTLSGLMPDAQYSVRAFMALDLSKNPEIIYSNTVKFQTEPDDV